jgi:Matrixin/Putative peptidoglycan binding domain
VNSESTLRFQITLTQASLGEQDPELEKVQEYLTRYGYLTTTISPGTLDAPTSEALETFQQVRGLEASGELNAETVRALQAPRCGNPDVGLIARAKGGTSAPFVLGGDSYNKTTFTYRFVNGTADITDTQERAAVRNAFNTWASALCGVTFQERTAAPVDFEIGWFTGAHGDDKPFDGVGNTRGHASLGQPPGGGPGKLHFDDAETWSLADGTGTTDVETVALHEIGHLLGLEHSPVPGSIMFSGYTGVQRDLAQDDMDGIRRLYPVLCHRGDSSASDGGFVSEIAVARHRRNQIVTAVRTQAGNLKLIGWNVGFGSITHTGERDSVSDAATFIDIARITDSRFVTACRSSSSRLFLISWEVNGSGTAIRRLKDSGDKAGNASMIRIAPLGDNRFVTACRDGSGDLLLIGWQLNNDDSLTRLKDSSDEPRGAVQDIALVTLPNNQFVTAVRAGDGHLLLISWDWQPPTHPHLASGIRRQRDSDTLAGSASMIRATVDTFGHVVTAVRAGNGNLLLITWAVDATTGRIQRLGDSAEGDSGDLAGETLGHDIALATGHVVTGVRTGNGNLKVILWNTARDGSISRVGDSSFLGDSASLITQCEELTGAPPIITSVRNSASSLKLISWSRSMTATIRSTLPEREPSSDHATYG